LNTQLTHCCDQVRVSLVLKSWRTKAVQWDLWCVKWHWERSLAYWLTSPPGLAVDFARFELLPAVFIKVQVFSYVTPCGLVNADDSEERSA